MAAWNRKAVEGCIPLQRLQLVVACSGSPQQQQQQQQQRIKAPPPQHPL
jgi:hypothetical protein